MSAAKKLDLVSVEDYLAGELASPIKHEYLGGVVYAMPGARNAHNVIATNITVAVGSRLRGRKCRPFNSDTKIRVRLPTHLRFYYPDCSVVCRPNPQDDSFQDDPAVIFEVISRSTRRTDEGEKRDAYLTIPSLSAYVIVEQEKAAVVVYRRTDSGFVPEVYEGPAAIIPLAEIETELPLSEMYEGVEFSPEPTEESQ
ncbi:Uma2 family endonuclease [Anatilimnocola sp. NA78]|uniref:Uma2 family endonuclease n=1 Tax=Anatilimnocola sp. NA78 TaxID=3415683 RepID=UPI003CE4EBEE